MGLQVRSLYLSIKAFFGVLVTVVTVAIATYKPENEALRHSTWQCTNVTFHFHFPRSKESVFGQGQAVLARQLFQLLCFDIPLKIHIHSGTHAEASGNAR